MPGDRTVAVDRNGSRATRTHAKESSHDENEEDLRMTELTLPRPRKISAALALLSALSCCCALAQRGDAFDAPLVSAEEERARFHVPPGFEVQLVAAEPAIQKPMNL